MLEVNIIVYAFPQYSFLSNNKTRSMMPVKENQNGNILFTKSCLILAMAVNLKEANIAVYIFTQSNGINI